MAQSKTPKKKIVKPTQAESVKVSEAITERPKTRYHEYKTEQLKALYARYLAHYIRYGSTPEEAEEKAHEQMRSYF